MLQMSVRSVDNFLAQGCPHLKLGERRVRFDLVEARNWFAETYRIQRRGAVRAVRNQQPGVPNE